jgi:hypothetical protein
MTIRPGYDGRRGRRVDYFYEAIAAQKDAISKEARARYVASYSEPGALT